MESVADEDQRRSDRLGLHAASAEDGIMAEDQGFVRPAVRRLTDDLPARTRVTSNLTGW